MATEEAVSTPESSVWFDRVRECFETAPDTSRDALVDAAREHGYDDAVTIFTTVDDWERYVRSWPFNTESE